MTRALFVGPTELLPRIERALAILGWRAEPMELSSAIAAMLAAPDTPAILHSDSVSVEALRCWQTANLIFVLTANRGDPTREARERAIVLAAGADDAQPADVDPRELAARIEALTRRHRAGPFAAIDLPGGAHYAADCGEFIRGEVRVRLTALEEKVFRAIAGRPAATVKRESIWLAVYGNAVDQAQVKIVDAVMCKLRKKVRLVTGGIDPFEMVWDVGYRFCPRGRPEKQGKAA